MLIHPVNTCEVPECFLPNEITPAGSSVQPNSPSPCGGGRVELGWVGLCCLPAAFCPKNPLPGSHQATVVSPRILVGLGVAIAP